MNCFFFVYYQASGEEINSGWKDSGAFNAKQISADLENEDDKRMRIIYDRIGNQEQR